MKIDSKYKDKLSSYHTTYLFILKKHRILDNAIIDIETELQLKNYLLVIKIILKRTKKRGNI